MHRQGIAIVTLFATTLPLFAGPPLGPEATNTLIMGNTLYIDLPKGMPGAPEGGLAAIYYDEDGRAAAQLPAGSRLTGTWRLQETGYCIDWENGPTNSCSVLSRDSDGFVVSDKHSGDARGTVTRISTGNPENL